MQDFAAGLLTDEAQQAAFSAGRQLRWGTGGEGTSTQTQSSGIGTTVLGQQNNSQISNSLGQNVEQAVDGMGDNGYNNSVGGMQKTGIGKTGLGIPSEEIKPEVLQHLNRDDQGAYGYLPKEGSAYEDFDFTDIDKVNEQRNIRIEYLQQSQQIQQEIDRLEFQGATRKEIATRVIDMRNQDKVDSRAEMSPQDRELLERRNIKLYNDPVGPTAEWLYERAKEKLKRQFPNPAEDEIWNEVIKGSIRKDAILNALLGLK